MSVQPQPPLSGAASLTPRQLTHCLRQMIAIREFEQIGEQSFKDGLIRGYYHSYSGQEAVGVGFLNTLDLSRDYVVDHYRDHGHCLLLGLDPEQIFAELFGRATGVSKGKGGSMHMYSPERHFLGGDGIVGGGLSVACGVGLALKHRANDPICICFFGDGALDTGTFHESLNLASLWSVPTLYICVNNLYSMGTRLDEHSSLSQLVDRAQGYGIKTEQVDGQDVFATTAAAERIYQYIRQTKRPYFVEILTYRYHGHGIQDKPQNYRTEQEEAQWHGRDPIQLLAAHLIAEKILNPQQIEDMRRQIVAELEAKVERAKQAPQPEAAELHRDVLA